MNKKGLAGVVKFSLIAVVLLIATLFVINYVLPSLAEDPVIPSLLTVDENGYEKIDFSPGESVYILGSGFSNNLNVSIEINETDINNTVDSGYSQTNENGFFIYEYVLPMENYFENYSVYASDGTNSAITIFTDNPGAIWTTEGDCGDISQDVNHYDVGDYIYINGEGFNEGVYHWEIKGQPGSCDSSTIVAQGAVSVSQNGSFCFNAYRVQNIITPNTIDDDCGVYKVKVGNKGDNYQVDAFCEQLIDKTVCQSKSCQWCEQCQWPTSPTKTNEWHIGKCIVPGVSCGWHCETGICGAVCSMNSDCSCSIDGCQGNDYYDYPDYGTCKDCTKACYCNVNTTAGQPCAPNITLNDPRCVQPQNHTACTSGTCTVVEGPGSNQCSINSDCYHSECDYVGRTCKQVNAWPDVTDTCTDFNQCVHKECVGESCIVIDSPGTSTCTSDSQCLTPKHSECSNGQCIQVNGTGSNQCSIASDCYHKECDFGLQQCKVVNAWPDVADTCTSNEQCTACVPDIVVDKKASPSSFSICQNTTITLNVTGVGCPQAVHFPLDTVLILDRSGSMDDDCHCADGTPSSFGTCTPSQGYPYSPSYPCKINDAKNAAKTFVNLTDATIDRNGLVSFSSTATLNQVLTFNKTAVNNAINSLVTSGNTAIGAAITVANNHISSSGRSNTTWIEILLTNGNPTVPGDNPIAAANSAKALDIPIYTIGLGADANHTLLQQIANITGGKYYFAPNGTVLQQIYLNISQEVLSIAGKNVVVKDVIPSYANYADVLSSNPADNCSYSAGSKTITCNLGTVLIGQSYIITFNEQLTESGHKLSNVYPASNVTFTDYNNTPQTRIFPETYVDVVACNDGNYCNGVETCIQGTCQQGTPVDCSNLNDQCNIGVCNEDLDQCVKDPKQFSTQCDNGFYCDGSDHCDGLGSCVSLGNPIDCSYLNDQCQEGVCSEGLDQCVPDYTNYPLSTSCESDQDLCTVDHCDGSGSCVKNYDVDCNYLDDDYCQVTEIWHDEGYCNSSDGQCYASSTFTEECYYYTEFCDINKRKSEEGICVENTGAYCDSTTNEIEDCSDNNYDQCYDTYYWQHYTESCYDNQGVTECLPASSTGDCRDDLWCDGQEYCSEYGGIHCEDASNVDCSENNISEVATCYFNPDLRDETFDWRNPFTSQCVEDGSNIGHCTSGNETVSHACADEDDTDGIFNYNSVTHTCEAECDGAGTECQNECVEDVWYYGGFCDLNSCSCEFDYNYDCNEDDGCYAYESGCEDRDYFCDVQGCDYTSSNQNTDYHDPYEQYCSGDTIREHKLFHDFYCNGICSDHTDWVDDQLVEDCSLQNDWYDSGETRWVTETQCTEREQKEQKYRTYTCSNVECVYTNTSTQWVNTTNTRPKPYSTQCDDGYWCSETDHCDGQGNCVQLTQRDCSGNDLVKVETCDWNPDNYNPTFDWRNPFTSQCVEDGSNAGHCTTGDSTIEHYCADEDDQDGGPIVPLGNGIRTCNAECDGFGLECLPYLGEDDYCYIDGQCDSEPTDCTCSWTQDGYCPPAGTVIDGYCYWGTRECDNEIGCTLNRTLMGCNDECDPVEGPKDTLGPITTQINLTRKCNIINVTANVSNCNKIEEAEYFFDECPDKNTRGQPMLALDGSFDQTFELVYVYNIDLANTTEILLDGRHNIYIRGKDEFGNWGNCSAIGFDLDIYPPYTAEQYVEPQMACGNNVTVTALVCEPIWLNQSFICTAEFFVDNFETANGEGFSMTPVDGVWGDDYCEWVTGTFDPSQLIEGTHYIKVHAMDCFCNWGKIDFQPYVWFIKDTAYPTSTKQLIPYDDEIEQCFDNEEAELPVGVELTDGCAYVKGGTQVVLDALDQDTPDHEYSNNVRIHWKVWYKLNPGDTWTVDQEGVGEINQSVTITLNDDSYHLIEFWAADSCGNEEPHHFELDIVDNKPPALTKIVGDPKVECDEEDTSNCEYFLRDHVTPIDLYCSDQTPHPVGQVQLWYRILLDGQVLQDWTDPTAIGEVHKQIIFNEDSVHTLQYYCEDLLGNSEGTREQPHQQIYRVDSESPTTEKTYGTPLVTTDGGYPKWITSSTPITLTAVDGGDVCHVGVNKTYWRNTIVADFYCLSDYDCQQAQGSGEWNEYTNPFYKPEQSCHLIEYYSVDLLENTEQIKKQCVFVENTPPVSQKQLGEPQKQVDCNDFGEFTDGCYYITQNTQINLTCSDGQPHPVDNVEIWYKIDWKNESSDSWTEGIWTEDSDFVTFNYDQDSYHRLTWYCVDALGNREQEHTELDIVDTQTPVITKTVGEPKVACQGGEGSFFDDVEEGQDGWTTDGLWHITDYRSYSSTHSWAYNEESDHDFDTGDTNSGELISPSIVLGTNSQLKFWSWEQTECDGDCSYDNREVFVSEDGGLNWNKVWEGSTENDWYQVTVDLSAYAGKTIKIKFSFDTGDEEANEYEGWYVDDIEITETSGSCWYITQQTPITLNCNDQDPHPVDNEVIYWRYQLNNNGTWFDFNYTGTEVTFYYPEDSNHTLEYWCVDDLNNEAQYQKEIDIVDTLAPNITKNIIGPQFYNEAEEKLYLDGVTEIELTCTDQQPHPVDNVEIYYRYRVDDGSWGGWTLYTGKFKFPEESKHELEYYCIDALDNEETHQFEIDYVDHTPPVTTKTYGTPLVTTDGGYPKWINSSTPITLTADDGTSIHASGVDKTLWRVTLVDDRYCSGEWNCNEAQGSGQLNEYTNPFTIPDQSCHLIEYYSVDNVNKTEITKKQCVYVENTPPVSQKDVGEPKHECIEGEWYQYGMPIDGCLYINQSSVITLTCSDGDPHPVDNVNIYYRDYLFGQQAPSFTLVPSGYVEINKNEDSVHVLEWYCVDALGNEEQYHYEIDIVDSQYPNVTKTVGEPKVSCGDDCWYITNETEITLECIDGEPHPVDHVSTYYRYYLDDVLMQDWTLYSDPFTLPEYSNHIVQYYCNDILGNTGPIFTEEDRVDNLPPVIIPDPCYNVRYEDKVIIWAIITDDKVGIDETTTKAFIECPGRDVEELLLVYNSTTDRYEVEWTVPNVEGVCYVDFAASDLLGNSAYLEDGKFIIVDNTPPEISSVFSGRLWIGLSDKFYVDAEVDDNSVYFEEVCEPLKCFVRIVDNEGKEGYLEGELEFVQGVLKCAGFVTVNDTFYEAQAQLWVDAIDGSGNMASERKLEPIGIDNARMIEIEGIDSEKWFRGGQWINDVVATVDSSKFGELISCSVSISGVSPENTLQPIDNTCSGNIRIPTDISDGEKTLTIYATNINGKIVSDAVNIRIDNNPPEKIILSPINGTYYSTDVPVILNVTDDMSGVYNVSFKVVKNPLVILGLSIPDTEYDSGWILTTFNGTTWNYIFNASDLTPGETYYFLSLVCDNAGNCQDPLSYTLKIILDRTPPAWPILAKLTVTSSPYDKDGTIILGWPVASDTTGVDHYDIYINGILKATTTSTAYTFTGLLDGYYTFSVIPVDKVSNKGSELTGSTTVNRNCAVDVTCTSGTTSTGGGGGGGGGGGVTIQSNKTSKTTEIIEVAPQTTQTQQTNIQECIPYWSCGSWSECIDEKQNRKCVDKNNCVDTAKTETQDCKIGTTPISGLTGFSFINSPIGYATIGLFMLFVILAILNKKKFF